MIATHTFIKKAKIDLLCYKVLDKKTRYSPFQNKEFIGVPYEGRFKTFAPPFFRNIEKGFLHACKTPERAEEIRTRLYEDGYKNKLEIFRAIIPKGTLYWEGEEDEYASRKITLK